MVYNALFLLIFLVTSQSRASVLSLVVYLFSILLSKLYASRPDISRIRFQFLKFSKSALVSAIIGVALMFIISQQNISGGIIYKQQSNLVFQTSRKMSTL